MAVLFGPEDFSRVGESELQGLEADCEHGDRQGNAAGEQKYHSPDGDTINEVLEPLVHQIPGYRGGDQHGYGDEPGETTGQH